MSFDKRRANCIGVTQEVRRIRRSYSHVLYDAKKTLTLPLSYKAGEEEEEEAEACRSVGAIRERKIQSGTCQRFPLKVAACLNLVSLWNRA